MSEENTTLLSFSEALNALDNASKESFLAEAWIPSLKKNIKIKEITAKQQKSLIESAIDSTVSKSTFTKAFYEIILANCLEDKSVIEQFTIVDKASIAFAMRYQISNTLKVVYSNEPKIENDLNLNDIISKFISYNHPEKEVISFSKNSVNIEVDICLPTILDEIKIDPFVYGKDKNEDQVEEIKSVILGAFLGETAKYIKDIRINDKAIGYSTLNVSQKIQFVEKFPATLVQNILSKVVKWKEELDNVYTVSYENISKTIEVDSLLFLTN